jgi:hypothetical protein
MKCIYCGTEPINATTKKDLKVCCCYMLQKRNGVEEQTYRTHLVSAEQVRRVHRKIQRFKKRIEELDNIDKTCHGHWSLGWYTGAVSMLEELLDIEVEENETEENHTCNAEGGSRHSPRF